MKIGLLVGREESFPRAFIEAVEGLGRDDLTAEFCKFGGTRHDELCGYDVIIDRISHEVPYYRLALKQAAMMGTRVVNNPFWSTADDKFFGYSLAAKLGLAVPRTVLLPDKDYGPDLSTESLRNLEYPIDWKAHVDWVGLPAFLKPATGGGWKNVYKVDSVEEMLYRYDQSGTTTMVLQRGVDFDRYIRCFGIGREEVIVCRYDPDNRCYLPVEKGWLDEDLRARIEHETLLICRALGYDCNTVEFAVENGVPYLIDFTNPAPDMEVWSITTEYFDDVVQAMVRMAVRLADRPAPATTGSWHELLWSGATPTKKAVKKKASAKKPSSAKPAAGKPVTKKKAAVKKAATKPKSKAARKK
ncbi:MAG: hypothetical protein KDB53_12935 [Planctomycetes bacterium]|nr:hypothetical protein [Planctomycetota bacterium]